MGESIYSAITSLDGYVADETSGFDWAAPAEEVDVSVNQLVGRAGPHLYGRRMFDVRVASDTIDAGPDRRRSATSRRSGGRRTRWSTRRRSMQCEARGRASSGATVRMRYAR
jgi:hypothetical protein